METRNDMPIFGAAIPVGSILKDILADRGMTQRELANQLGMQPSHLSEMMKGARKITPQIAMDLERVLGGRASMWLKLQAQYDCNVIALREREARERATAEQDAASIIRIYDSIIEWCREGKRQWEARLQQGAVPASV